MRFYIISAVILCHFVISEAQTCQTDADCSAGQCCQILSEYMIVSKRAGGDRTGTCGTYKPEGARCNNFDIMNGYCGCATGLECKTYKDPNYQPLLTSRALHKRKMAPGYISTCEKP